MEEEEEEEQEEEEEDDDEEEESWSKTAIASQFSDKAAFHFSCSLYILSLPSLQTCPLLFLDFQSAPSGTAPGELIACPTFWRNVWDLTGASLHSAQRAPLSTISNPLPPCSYDNAHLSAVPT